MILTKQSQGSIGVDIYVHNHRDWNALTLATGLQALQLMEEPKETFFHLGLETEEALRVVTIPQSQLPTEGREDGR